MSAAGGTERKLVTAHAGRRSAKGVQTVKSDPEPSSPPNEPASDDDDDYHPDDSEEDVEDEDDPTDPDAGGDEDDGTDADEPIVKSQDSEADERPRAATAPDDGVELTDEVRDSKSKALPAAEARKLMTAAAVKPKKSKAKRKHEGKTTAAAKPVRAAKKPKPADLDCCICGATQTSSDTLVTDLELGYTRGFCVSCFHEITKQKRCSECLRPTLWAGNIGLTCRCTKHGCFSILCKICSYDDSVEVNVSESGVRLIPFYCDQCTTDEFATNEPIVYAVEVPEKKKKGVTFSSKPDVAPAAAAASGGADDDESKSTIPAAVLIAMNSPCRFFSDFETCTTTQPTGTTIYCSSCELYQCEKCMQKCDTCSLEWCEVCVNMCPHKAPSNYGPIVYGTATALRGALSSTAATAATAPATATTAASAAPKTATAAAASLSSSGGNHMDNKHKATPTGDTLASLAAVVEMSFCTNKKCDDLSSDVCKACTKFVCASAACNLTCTSCNETVCVNCIVRCDTPGCGNTRCALCTAEDRAQPAQVDFYCYECATRPEP